MERINKSFKIVLLLFIVLYSGPLAAQKFGYIDSEYILNKHPDYKLVQEELKKLSEEWKKEAQNLEQEVKELSTQLKAEEVLLTEEMYQKRIYESGVWDRWSILPKAGRTPSALAIQNLRCH
jgi:outer membrane protein